MKHVFLTFAFLSVLTVLSAQPPFPGGVSSPELWFKTVSQTSDLQGNYLWRDFGGDSVQLRLYDSRGVSYGSEYFTARALIRTYNFHPALDLSEINASKQFSVGKSNLSQATVISVWGADYGDFNQDMFLYALNGRAGEGYIFTKDKLLHGNESGKGILDYGSEEGKDLIYQNTDEEADINRFREGALKIATYQRVLQPNTSVWGERNEAVISIGEIFHPEYSLNTSTYNTGALNNRAFFGYTPEFIIYNRILTPLERRKVETYLAVKYALTQEQSCISSGNALLWDIDANAGFNSRVTGYGRDDAAGLYQKRATTSYEEATWYSDDYSDLYDSYDLNNSYNLPSRYRLLVIGRQPASPIPDGGFVLFGDNSAGITAQSEEGINGIKLMPRRWLVNTNIAPATEASKQFSWQVQDLDVYTDGFKTKATMAGASSAASGSLVTQTPLLDKDGYFSFTIASVWRPLTVKFGTSNPQIADGTHDYGYYISFDGLVYKIFKGVRQPAAIATVFINQKIEVGKEGNTLYLRANGIRLFSYDIQIDAADIDKPYYGSIKIDKFNTEDIVLSDIRQGGFSDTGNNVELSYIAERAGDFFNYRTGGKTYLIIDRTGTGDFSSENIEYIPADELDEMRYKIIFNNIFWDTDGNGKDVFTFGYRQSNLVAVVTPTDPTCVNDILQSNGAIDVKIKQGFAGFSYNLKNTQTQSEQTGTFYSDSIKIDSLPAGTYEMTLSEIGGFNLYPKQAGNYASRAIGSTFFYSTVNAYLEWTVAAGTQASAGMSVNAALQSNPNSQTIGYGLHIRNNNLYQINSGAVSPTPITALQQGDKIRVERIANRIFYKLNGQELLSVDMRPADYALLNYPFAEVSTGGIYNLTWNAMTPTDTWVKTDNLAVEKSSGDSFIQTVTLSADCEEPQPEMPQTQQGAKASRLTVYYKNPNSMQEVTAKIELPEPEPVSLLLFDAAGQYLFSTDIPKGTDIVEADIRLPGAGVYIIKAFTGAEEYSAKVISK